MSYLTPGRFIPNDLEELSALEMIGKHDTQIANKTDLRGDHKGSWHGISKPVYSEPGIAGVVEQNSNKITDLNEQLADILINVKSFGAVGDGVADDRQAIECAIESIKTTGGKIYFPNGIYYINSYSENTTLANSWGQIFPLYSNITFEFAQKCELRVGLFFDDKKFILFSGYNTTDEATMTKLENIKFSGGLLTFSGSNSMMRLQPLKRVAIGTGVVDGVVIEDMTFKDGDLRNCIIGGLNKGCNYLNVRNCKFIDLVQNGANNDYTAIYCNMQYSHVSDCEFINNNIRKGWEIGTPVELHRSHSTWTNSSVYKYNRGCFLVSHEKETDKTEYLEVTGINGVVTNELANLWCDDNTQLINVNVHDNNIVSMTRDSSMTSTLVYSTSGLFTTSGGNRANNAVCRFVTFKNNVFVVPTDSRNDDLSTVFQINNNSLHLSDLTLSQNTTSTKSLCYTKGCDSFVMDKFIIKDNDFNTSVMSSSLFGLFTVKGLKGCYIDIELKTKPLVQMTYLLRFIVTDSCSNNTIIIKPQNTENITKPLMATESVRQGSLMSYPDNASLIIGSQTGIFFTHATKESTIKKAQLLSYGTLPTDVYTTGSFFLGADSALRTIVQTNGDKSGTYSVRLLVSN